MPAGGADMNQVTLDARPTRARTSLVAVLGLALLAALLPALVAGQTSSAEAATAPVMKRYVIGKSVKGRPIYAFHRYYPGAKKTTVVIGSIHGDEKAGMRVVALLKKRTPARNLNLWLIPTANPDGTAAYRRTNAHGVDLNRNFPYRWRSINHGKETWSGPSAASEPETRALRDFIRWVHPRITVTFHQPLFGVGRNSKRPGVGAEIARMSSLPLKSFTCTGACYGSFTSWHNVRTDGVAVTVEFGHPRVSDWRIGKVTTAVLSVGSRY